MDVFTLNKNFKRIVVIGGGFGGIAFSKKINTRKYEVLLLDKHNYFTFQPLLYQVATGGLEPDSVAYPLRKIFSREKNIIFRMAEIQSIDTSGQMLMTTIGKIPYDKLIIATGSQTNFFNLEETKANSLTLKSVTDALGIRSFILENFEAALLTSDIEEQKKLMNFIIVGGGPTGVEVSGAIAELKRHVLPVDYPEIDFSLMKITVLESGKKILDSMSGYAKEKGMAQLEDLGVEVILNKRLINYDGSVIKLDDGTGIETKALIWTAGVMGNIPQGFKPDLIVRGNRLLVDDFNKITDFSNIFSIGDVCALKSGGHPMLAPVAIQQAHNLARNLNLDDGKDWRPFKYFDKGTMATIGRSRAVADLKFIHLKGFMAWLAWLFIHLILLVGFRNKIIVLFNWFWNYFSYDKAIRLIIRPYERNGKHLQKEEAVKEI